MSSLGDGWCQVQLVTRCSLSLPHTHTRVLSVRGWCPAVFVILCLCLGRTPTPGLRCCCIFSLATYHGCKYNFQSIKREKPLCCLCNGNSTGDGNLALIIFALTVYDQTEDGDVAVFIIFVCLMQSESPTFRFYIKIRSQITTLSSSALPVKC